MMKKNYTRTGRLCRVTFKIPPTVKAEQAALCGDFNQWDQTTHPMKRLKNGGFSSTITLTAGRSYRFRYLLDQKQWENDEQADRYQKNVFGSEDSIVQT